jgi:hypothetical protein
MRRVIVVPITDVSHFPDLEVIAQNGNLVALAGGTTPGRMRAAFDSDEAFLEAVSRGFADRHAFHTLGEAVKFADSKLASLASKAKEIEEIIAAGPRPQPAPARTVLFEKRKRA